MSEDRCELTVELGAVEGLDRFYTECGAPLPRGTCPFNKKGCPNDHAERAKIADLDMRPTHTRVELRADATLLGMVDKRVKVELQGSGVPIIGRLVAIAWNDSPHNHGRLPTILLLEGRKIIPWPSVALIEEVSEVNQPDRIGTEPRP